ncbi:hypothetical protein GCM10011376_08790 [Nocardioides flavus (ex Wang et al. 2016)]|uniref:Uncharacterized protein n=1 Tax=Nocardioides flavus (ex Wang et al. 2016) TaxID=2058780 RepID=A0ABQ3HHV1_9ACTN|nr:hypothetical protein [Nocardioides flavus (ex Wang et al. 2016)]GHE16269.1 hypothetical protein GCM10011376_08790 [Nocardioides flavus (ex Wang et al. 2016)]
MNDFNEVLRSLSGDDPRGNIAMLKGAVKEQLTETDSRVEVELTDHFNHAYVPDLVLSWPGTSERRHMFLRTAFREADMARDIDVLGEDRPIFMSLDRLPDEPPRDELVTRAKATNSLVTDPYGLEVLEEVAEAKPVVSLFNHAILQGGRGVVTSRDALDTGTSVDAGFDGARGGDAGATSAAIEAAASVLDSHRAGQVNRLLHAVWVGSGGSGSSFPGGAGITAVLDAESLRFVLELPDIEDDDFWVRLGSGLTTGRLCELQDFPPSENFQKLLRGAASRLESKACRVLGGRGAAPTPLWSVATGSLVLSVNTDDVYFAPFAAKSLPAPEGDTPSATVRDLQERASSAEIRLGEVRLSNGSHTIAYGAEDGVDLAEADDLEMLENVLTSAALVSASAYAGTREVKCNFVTRTAAGNSSSKFLLSELVDIAVPLLIAPEAPVMEAVEELLTRSL